MCPNSFPVGGNGVFLCQFGLHNKVLRGKTVFVHVPDLIYGSNVYLFIINILEVIKCKPDYDFWTRFFFFYDFWTRPFINCLICFSSVKL